jgi:hypothetical protein
MFPLPHAIADKRWLTYTESSYSLVLPYQRQRDPRMSSALMAESKRTDIPVAVRQIREYHGIYVCPDSERQVFAYGVTGEGLKKGTLRMAWKKMRSVVATAAAVMVCTGILASCGTSGSAADKTVDTALSASASSNGIDSASAVTAEDDASDATGTDAMPSNPSQELPDSVDSSIPNNATVVSSDLAVTKDGTVKNLETGETVTDPEIVGTEDTPPDPLAKTNGQRFIPVSVKTVRNAIKEESNTKASALRSKALSSVNANAMSAVLKSSTGTSVRQTALLNNEYGAYWGSYGGTQAFFERGGALFAQNAKGVVDVSEHNGTIDWAKAKANGVQGVIIRLGFGWGNRLDYQAQRNIRE